MFQKTLKCSENAIQDTDMKNSTYEFEKFVKSLYDNWDFISAEEQGDTLRCAFIKMHEEQIDWSQLIIMDDKEKERFVADLKKRIRNSKNSERSREYLSDYLEQPPNSINGHDDEDNSPQDWDKCYDKLLNKLPALEAEAVRLLAEPDLKPALSLGFDERGLQMIRRRAYIRLLWNSVKPNAD